MDKNLMKYEKIEQKLHDLEGYVIMTCLTIDLALGILSVLYRMLVFPATMVLIVTIGIICIVHVVEEIAFQYYYKKHKEEE